MSDSSSSVTQWIADLKAGEAQALSELWNRYFEQLIRVARDKLGKAPRGVLDEEDIAVSVLKSLWQGASAQQFDRLTNRQDLWCLLVTLTQRQAVDELRRVHAQKRGGGRVRAASELPRSDSVLGDLESYLDDQPTPRTLAIMDEQFQYLLKLLPQEDLQQVAVWRMEGYSNQEIADRLGLSIRSVCRKIEMIRRRWEEEVSHAG